MEIRIDLPDAVRMIIDRFKTAGYRADVVGGAVRDALLGREGGDYDITTDCLPEKVKEVFSEYQILDTGIKHGTVTLLVDHTPYEITTYRLDGEYRDGRHPECVTFSSSLREDTARRDFTVNALCYNHIDGLSDFHCGLEDLSARVIRTVGEAGRRFDEDALRILRALRFSSVLGFEIEKATADAIRLKKENLSEVSRERIYVEWCKLLEGGDAWKVLSSFSEVVAVFIPELADLKLPARVSFDSADGFIRSTSLFYLNCTEPSLDFDEAMHRLKTDNHTRNRGVALLDNFDIIKFSNVRAVLIDLYNYGLTCVCDALELGRVLGRFGERECELLRSAIDSGLPYRLSMLNFKGEDAAALGLRGQRIGETLELALFAVINGECENDRDALSALCQKGFK